MIKNLIFIFIFISSDIVSQSENNSFRLKEKNFALSLNYDQNGYFSDSYIHYNLYSGLFTEVYVNDLSLRNNNTTIYNLTVGFMKLNKHQVTIGTGYTNYFNRLSDIEHEFFLGINYDFLSAIIYLDFIENNFSFQSIFNVNSVISNLPVNISQSITFDGENFESFFDISKTFNNNIFVGYILSREQFEDIKTKDYSKNGKSGTYESIEDGTSFFNEFYLGFYF
jgi:hypothetical protein